jgi:hypothetical protein
MAVRSRQVPPTLSVLVFGCERWMARSTLPDIMVLESRSATFATQECDERFIKSFLGSDKIIWPVSWAFLRAVLDLADLHLARVVIGIQFSLPVEHSRDLVIGMRHPLFHHHEGLLLRVAVAVLVA